VNSFVLLLVGRALAIPRACHFDGSPGTESGIEGA
jgi:hypothetical protein